MSGASGGVCLLDVARRRSKPLYRSPIGSHVILLVWSRHDLSMTVAHSSQDVVKSRVQLRPFPPTETPLKYIPNEIRAILSESGV